jgi:hypothetical protein
MPAVERTQISLVPEQAARLRRLARERRTSMAALIRDAVDRTYPAEADDPLDARWERALSIVGAFAGDGSNVSEEHDRYLEEAYLDWRS